MYSSQMRLNKFVALATGMSRRAADAAIEASRVRVNGRIAELGQTPATSDVVTLDNRAITPPVNTQTIMLNKPVGYVSSRDGQGSKTIYDLLPESLHHLKPVGRLDKDSSGLLLMTNDGQLAQQLTHPKFEKVKKYKIALNKLLSSADFQRITGQGIDIGDSRPSKLELKSLETGNGKLAKTQVPSFNFQVTLSEGRNRQIRRTFEALGYNVVKLHRTHFGRFSLDILKTGKFKPLD